jgi:hypothetical protein
LIFKLLDDDGWGFDAQGDYSFVSRLDADEQAVLDELLDKVFFIVELCGPLLLFLIPLTVYLVRVRL